jgi:hypothetical protein
MFNEIKDDDKYKWTNHVKEKMAYYRLSPSIVKRVIRFPNRTEEGIAPKTVAVMQSKSMISRAKGKEGKKTEEIWVMFQLSEGTKRKPKNKLEEYINSNQPKKTIISAWRYPGVSPEGKKIEIPEDTLIALENEEFE